VAGVSTRGDSRWQKRHTLAAAGMSDRQDGQSFDGLASICRPCAVTAGAGGRHATITRPIGPRKKPSAVPMQPLSLLELADYCACDGEDHPDEEPEAKSPHD
jgi:hypothetical protein